MRLARFETDRGREVLVSSGGDWLRISGAGEAVPDRITDLLGDPWRARLAAVLGTAAHGRVEVALDGALTISEGDIWGAGLNYRGHSADLDTEQPKSGPGSYLRPRGCLIDNGGRIELPSQSQRVTAEAELGLVVGSGCKNVRREDWRSVLAGVTAVLDLTAEDVIRENPRYIPWAKGFDTFCSIGPQLITMDEFEDRGFESIQVSTVRNGEVVASAPVAEMKYDLAYLVEYFSAGRTLMPGTVICTGTPGAAVIQHGDSISAVVEGIGTLTHTVSSGGAVR